LDHPLRDTALLLASRALDIAVEVFGADSLSTFDARQIKILCLKIARRFEEELKERILCLACMESDTNIQESSKCFDFNSNLAL
jgi:hypothetical protein